MNNALTIATEMQAALVALTWVCGPVQAQQNGEIGFMVTIPALRGAMKTARTQIRTFANDGTMTVIAVSE